MKVNILDTALIQHELSILRDSGTGGIAFRKGLQHLGRYFAYEISQSFPRIKRPVATPLDTAVGVFIEGLGRIVIVNVLRAAIPLVEGLLSVFFEARVGIISAFRSEAPPFSVQIDYVRVPKIEPEDTLIVADPMVATGSTMSGVLKELERFGAPRRTVLACILTTSVALSRLEREFPSLHVYTSAVDSALNDQGYIVPGLGDAGDRAFLTL
jgi:uracil phosphoribosyltransferase